LTIIDTFHQKCEAGDNICRWEVRDSGSCCRDHVIWELLEKACPPNEPVRASPLLLSFLQGIRLAVGGGSTNHGWLHSAVRVLVRITTRAIEFVVISELKGHSAPVPGGNHVS